MPKALWVLCLPKGAKALKKVNQKVSFGDKLAQFGNKFFNAPCPGKVVDLAKNKIKLEFKTEKLVGSGVGEGRCWGELVFVPEIGFPEISADHKNKILFVRRANKILLRKAAVLSVAGIVCFSFEKQEDLTNCQIPVLIVSEDSDTEKLLASSGGINCLLNLPGDCFLIPQLT
ncbi:hypothetical protein KKD61_01500 [Patescibacteria group bacterium]|nr:hypothetical protein [Patescibacteria group bacterium]